MSWSSITALLLVIAGLAQIAMAVATLKRDKAKGPDEPVSRGLSSPAAGFVIGALLISVGMFSLVT
jgi:hypothetical protein